MAKEMILVSLAEWERMKSKHRGQTTDPHEEVRKPAISVLAIEEVDHQDSAETKDKTESILDLLPKVYKARGRVLLHYLSPKLDSDYRLSYSDGVRSSHVLDLIKFAINPLAKRVPFDAYAFYDLLAALGVPASAYAVRDLSSFARGAGDAGGVWLRFQ